MKLLLVKRKRVCWSCGKRRGSRYKGRRYENYFFVVGTGRKEEVEKVYENMICTVCGGGRAREEEE